MKAFTSGNDCGSPNPQNCNEGSGGSQEPKKPPSEREQRMNAVRERVRQRMERIQARRESADPKRSDKPDLNSPRRQHMNAVRERVQRRIAELRQAREQRRQQALANRPKPAAKPKPAART